MTAPAPALPRRRPRRGLFVGLVLLLLGAFVVSLGTSEEGVVSATPPSVVLRVIATHLPLASRFVRPLDTTEAAVAGTIVWTQRLPRVVGGLLIGAMLALAGVAFQSLLMNPLADPYMVGVSAGSALGSVGVILAGGTGLLAGFAPTLAAFTTGLLAMAIVYGLARLGGRLNSQTFLLAGIVIGSFAWSIIQLIVALSLRSRDPGQASTILSQLLGSILYIDWRQVALLAGFGAIGTALLATGARELNLMALGEESAAHLGMDTEAFKRRVIVAGSLVTAASVAVAGIIAFVGLVVPHIGRRLIGSDHRVLLPFAMLLGGLTLLIADWLSRVFLHGLEIGVITSLIGAPVFCYLLRQRMVARS